MKHQISSGFELIAVFGVKITLAGTINKIKLMLIERKHQG